MLKKFQKLENDLNELLLKIIRAIKALLLRLTPKILIQFNVNLRESWINFYYVLRDRSINGFLENKDRAIYYKEKIFNSLNRLQEYPFKTKAQEVKILLSQQLRLSPLTHLKNCRNLLVRIWSKLSSFFSRFSKGQIATTIVTLAIFSLGSYTVIKSSSFIWYKENQAVRAPATAPEVIKKPDYYNLDKKTFVVLNIRIPVLAANVKEIQSVTIDFGVKTSNRFTKLFLEEYEHKLKDHFFMTIEPIESSFPIRPEGKDIIREKIQYELNKFLKQENVEGKIESVTILYIIAT